MERKKWILTVVGIIVICVAILVIVYVMLSGPVTNGLCYGTVSLQDPVSIGENVWKVEIEDVDMEVCSPDLKWFQVALAPNGSAISASHMLQSGLVAIYDPIVIFFADYGKIGSVDAGDLFYLVNLETESAYDFYVGAGMGPPASVTIYT